MPDGSTVSYNDEANDYGIPREQKYLNQLQYLNGRILEMVDKIKQASVVPPVIVLAADEGPYPVNSPRLLPKLAEISRGNRLIRPSSVTKLTFSRLLSYPTPPMKPKRNS
ncbi:hypothetical protein IPG36_00685 [bacterium]|nr:MAG: hypothetical protein IPG36_00685 [bacterium]